MLPSEELTRTAGTQESDVDGLWHVVITRFSYRNLTQTFENRRRAADQSVRKIDPLDPQRLRLRAKLFELTCAPSLMAQTCDNFDWVIIVDKDLPDNYRQALIAQVGARPRTHLHEFSSKEDLTRSAWLKAYAPSGVSRLLTTILDDDDALPTNFVAAMQTYVTDNLSLPPIMTLGSKSCVVWEAISSPRAPLGYQRLWFRGDEGMVMSAGFSLLSQHPEVDLTVFSMDHVLGNLWYRDEDHCPKILTRELMEFRLQTAHFFERSKVWSASHGIELFVDVSPKTGPVVMTNHFFNDEAWRLLDYKADRHRVSGDESFPQVKLKLGAFTKNSKLFSKRWGSYLTLIRQASLVSQLSYWRKHWQRQRLYVAVWITWRFLFL